MAERVESKKQRENAGFPAVLRGKSLVRPAGVEPTPNGLEVRCSIRLSYGREGVVDILMDWQAYRN